MLRSDVRGLWHLLKKEDGAHGTRIASGVNEGRGEEWVKEKKKRCACFKIYLFGLHSVTLAGSASPLS
jgi:hypothetical protein